MSSKRNKIKYNFRNRPCFSASCNRKHKNFLNLEVFWRIFNQSVYIYKALCLASKIKIIVRNITFAVAAHIFICSARKELLFVAISFVFILERSMICWVDFVTENVLIFRLTKMSYITFSMELRYVRVFRSAKWSSENFALVWHLQTVRSTRPGHPSVGRRNM